MASPVAEMAGFDAQHGWHLLYSRFGPVGSPGPEERAIVAVLCDPAGDGPALELAVGDGRIAIPLAETGIEVDGIDISPNGPEQIRAHPRGGTVNASVADMSDFTLGRTYSLVYCVANSLFNVTTQEGQLSCFERVAEHLAPGGVFLVHSSYTPRWFEGLRHGQYVEARHLELKFTRLQALRVDPAEQLVHQQDMWLSKQGISLIPMVHRYASLAELDPDLRRHRGERPWGPGPVLRHRRRVRPSHDHRPRIGYGGLRLRPRSTWEEGHRHRTRTSSHDPGTTTARCRPSPVDRWRCRRHAGQNHGTRVDATPAGPVHHWLEVLDITADTFSFRWTFLTERTGDELTWTTTFQIRTVEQVVRAFEAQSFAVGDVREGDIFIASRR